MLCSLCLLIDLFVNFFILLLLRGRNSQWLKFLLVVFSFLLSTFGMCLWLNKLSVGCICVPVKEGKLLYLYKLFLSVCILRKIVDNLLY